MKQNYSVLARFGGMVIFLLSVSFALMMALPFQPYRHLSFPEIDETACTNGAVTVQADREVVAPSFSTLDRSKVVSTWVDASDGSQIAAGEASLNIGETDLERLQSPIVRQAPGTPGTYYLYAETTTYGTVGVLPRHSTIGTTSDHPVEVVEC